MFTRPDIALRKCCLLLPSGRERAISDKHLSRYFCNPNNKSYIEAIPGTYAAESEKKYEGINSGQYLVQRLAATY